MSKRGPPNSTPKERSQSPTNADNSKASGSRKRTQSGDELSTSAPVSQVSSPAGGLQPQGSMRPNQGITPAASVQKPRGLALPPPSAAIGYNKPQSVGKSSGGLALPPASAAIGYGKSQDSFRSTGGLALPPSSAATASSGSQNTPKPARGLAAVPPSSSAVGYASEPEQNSITYTPPDGSNQNAPSSATQPPPVNINRCDQCYRRKLICAEANLLPRCRNCSDAGFECTQKIQARRDQGLDREIVKIPPPIINRRCDRCYTHPFECGYYRPPCQQCVADGTPCTDSRPKGTQSVRAPSGQGRRSKPQPNEANIDG